MFKNLFGTVIDSNLLIKHGIISFSFICRTQFPIGIDSQRFIRTLEVPQVQEHIKELKERYAGKKVLFFLPFSFPCSIHKNSPFMFFEFEL